jgi:transposase
VAELGERGLKVDYRSVWEFVRAEALTYKKRRWSPASAPAPMSRAGVPNG